MNAEKASELPERLSVSERHPHRGGCEQVIQGGTAKTCYQHCDPRMVERLRGVATKAAKHKKAPKKKGTRVLTLLNVDNHKNVY